MLKTKPKNQTEIAAPPPAVDTPAKRPRAPRAMLTRDYPEIGGRIVERKGVVTGSNGVNYPVREYVCVLPDGETVFATLRDAQRHMRSLMPSAAKRSRGARRADPMGTLTLIRAARAIDRIVALRPDPATTAALAAAVESINNDLIWQSETGVDVAAIRATEDSRIAKVREARTAKE